MRESNKPVVAAVIGNAAIAATKFTTAAFTGSSAMISEGIHSVVDMGNGGLLLFGEARSRRRPDLQHPFGHGQDVYFWSLIVAISIFGIGGGMSAYEGIRHLLAPAPISDPTWNYITLGISAVFELASFTFALRGFLQQKGDRSWVEAIRQGDDPSVYTVLFEDSAAIVGLAFAVLGTWLTHVTGDPVYDGSASIAIGILLAGVAFLLARESKQLLIGRSAPAPVVEEIARIVRETPGVAESGDVLTMHLGPSAIMVDVHVHFDPGLDEAGVRAAAGAVERRVKEAHPDVARVLFEL